MWWTARPQPAPPWNHSALAGKFEYVESQAGGDIAFYYVLANQTDQDYELPEGKLASHLTLVGVVTPNGQPDPILGRPNPNMLTITTPLFLPAHRQSRASVVLKYLCPITPIPADASREQEQEHRRLVAEYVRKSFPRLSGFAMFDGRHHYEIRFNAGW